MRDAADGPITHVVVLETLGAVERRRLGRRGRAFAADDPEPAPVTTARASVVHSGQVLDGEDAARRWMKGAGDAEIEAGVRVLDRILHAHRVAARDAGAVPVSLDRALAIRVGYAGGEQAARGVMAEGIELPVGARRARGRRASVLRPQEHAAAIIAGRTRALAAESLSLRARDDLDAGRVGDAAAGVAAAVDAAVGELRHEGPSGDLAARVEELAELIEPARTLVPAALSGKGDTVEIEHVLGRLEAALRLRATQIT